MLPVALGLGSNKGFRGLSCLEILAGAAGELKKILGGLECSGVYRTRAMYYEDQDDFYNMAALALVPDGLDAFGLLGKIHKVEADFGRDRSAEIRNGPRPLDIDIELFGSERIRSERLVVPHPRLKERAFVLVPLVEILAKDADNIKWKGFGSEKISELKNSLLALCGREVSPGRSRGVQKIMDAEAFGHLLKEERYGTRNAGNDECSG